jgi:hypothetical protein
MAMMVGIEELFRCQGRYASRLLARASPPRTPVPHAWEAALATCHVRTLNPPFIHSLKRFTVSRSCRQHVRQIKGHIPSQEARQGQEEGPASHQRAATDQCTLTRRSGTWSCQHIQLSAFHRVQPVETEQRRCASRKASEGR